MAQHFYSWVSCAFLCHAVGHREAPSLLIPRDSQRGIAISIIRDEDIRLDSGNGLHELANPFYAAIPFGIEFLLIQAQPRFKSGQASDDLLLANLHRTADCSLSRIRIHEGGFNQVFSTQEKTAALRTGQALAAGEAVKINSHL